MRPHQLFAPAMPQVMPWGQGRDWLPAEHVHLQEYVRSAAGGMRVQHVEMAFRTTLFAIY
jgi:hypothetical protein